MRSGQRNTAPTRLPLDMITYFEAHNFKSIKKLTIHMRPFMVLVGPNGSGKTNVVRALELFGDLIRRGTTDPVRDQGYDQVIRREQRPARAGLSFTLHLTIPPDVAWRSSRHVQADALGSVQLEMSIKLSGSVNSEEVRIKSESLTLKTERGTCSVTLDDNKPHVDMGSDPNLSHFLVPLVRSEAPTPAGPTAARIKESLSAAIEGALSHEEDTERRVLRLLSWQRVMAPWMRYLRDSVGVTRLRLDSSALRTESSVDAVPRSLLIGPSGEGLAAAVARLRGRGTEPTAAFRSVLEALQRVFPRIEDVRTERIQTGRLILSFKERGISDPLGQANISDGVLHALALLLAIDGGLGGIGLLAIEEPENAIHPWSTRAMIERAQDLRPQRQILITTHSETVVNAVRDPSCLFVVENSNKDGTQVTSATDRESALESVLRESGQKLGDVWIDGSLGGVPQRDD